MSLIQELLQVVPDGTVEEVHIGLHWTAVSVQVDGTLRCGLASTLHGPHQHSGPDVPQAGRLTELTARELGALAELSDQPTLCSLGVAALNALLSPGIQETPDINAEEMIARLGAGKRVALVGHFPFVEHLRERVGELVVLELNPRPGDLPAEAAPEVLAGAEVAAITGMTVQNHTLESLLRLAAPGAVVLVLGPSTPMHPCLFEHGIGVLSGSLVTNIPNVMRLVSQGANFRQIHHHGVSLVNLVRPDLAAILS
ncbi:MAG TPA: DUF364 domain-containing protein [Anaerolineales bacterium]|nr:DUF364 domain-containing protein [Anaerolineales bacterium]